MYEKIWSSWYTGPFRINHNQKERLYNQSLAQKPEESGGHEAKNGENTLHQIVPPIRLIILYISINIPPEQQLRVPIIQPLMYEGERFSHATPNTPLLSQSVSWFTSLIGSHAFAMASCLPGMFKWKETPPSLGPPSLDIIMALSLNTSGSSGSTFYFKPASH